jgi:RsmE family RNA methyltransferase
VNLLLVDPDELTAAGEVVLDGRRARHVRTVLRARLGDRIRVGVVRGRRGSGTVVELTADRCRLEVELSGGEPAPPAVDLVLAVPRPKVVSRAVQIAASFGVARIDLVNAWKVDKSYLGSKRLEPAALRDDARLGCEQGATTWLPELAVHRLFVPFVDGPLAARLTGAAGLVCDPTGEAGAERVAGVAGAPRVVVAIGPERGWIEPELASLRGAGFAAVQLTAGILRTEAAIAAALAQVELLRRQ